MVLFSQKNRVIVTALEGKRGRPKKGKEEQKTSNEVNIGEIGSCIVKVWQLNRVQTYQRGRRKTIKWVLYY